MAGSLCKGGSGAAVWIHSMERYISYFLGSNLVSEGSSSNIQRWNEAVHNPHHIKVTLLDVLVKNMFCVSSAMQFSFRYFPATILGFIHKRTYSTLNYNSVWFVCTLITMFFIYIQKPFIKYFIIPEEGKYNDGFVQLIGFYINNAVQKLT